MPVIVRIALVVTGAAFLLTGCGSRTEAPETAAVTVVVEPTYIQPTWELIGPGPVREFGRGDATFENLVEGGYFMAWGPVRGFALPPDNRKVQYLGEEGAISFTGRYTVLPNTLMIDVAPDSIGARWSLSGPGGYLHASAGDTTMLDMPPGEYILTWEPYPGWVASELEPVSRNLVERGSARFVAEYRRRVITIDAEPNTIDAPWEIVGPGAFHRTGTGDEALTDLASGAYTITWLPVTGWITPAPDAVSVSLVDGRNATAEIEGTYRSRTVTIDADPDIIGAPWHITGPNGFDRSGTSDTVFGEMLPGIYSITWGEVDLWVLPDPAAVELELTEDAVLEFPALYSPSFTSLMSGSFQMGSPAGESGREDHETLHGVTLTHGFQIQVAEVTNAQYLEALQWAYEQGYVTRSIDSVRDGLDGSTVVLKLIGEASEIIATPDGFTCINPGHPVKHLTWYGAAAYCDWLSLREGLPRAYDHATWVCNGGNPYTAAGYRLPTEAEWEFACRAGTTTAFASGPLLDIGCDDANLERIACYCGNSGGWSCPVGFRAPNGWNLYDMHGNVMEWCNDFYGAYGAGPETDPIGPASGVSRVVRGGNWNYHAQYCRSANRDHYASSDLSRLIGVRPVRTAS